MSINTVRNRLLYLKDALQGMIYVALTYTNWLATFSSVLALAIKPLLGLTLTTMAVLQAWVFYHSTHKNLDGWVTTVGGLTGALLNNIGSIGGFIARIAGFSFAVAPWFIVAGFAIGSFSQGALAIVNFFRAYESPPDSCQRKHYVQAGLFNLLTSIQLSACATALILFNLVPAVSLLISALALVVVTANICNSIWRTLPCDTKRSFKKNIGLGKPIQDKSVKFIAENQ